MSSACALVARLAALPLRRVVVEGPNEDLRSEGSPLMLGAPRRRSSRTASSASKTASFPRRGPTMRMRPVLNRSVVRTSSGASGPGERDEGEFGVVEFGRRAPSEALMAKWRSSSRR